MSYKFSTSEYSKGKCLILSGEIDESQIDQLSKTKFNHLKISQSLGWNNSSIKFLLHPTFSQVEILEIYSQNVKDLSPILELKKIKHLGTNCPINTELDLKNLEILSTLKFYWNKKFILPEESINIKHLNIVKYPYEDLEKISNYPNLLRLQIQSRKIKSLKGVNNYSYLNDLDFFNCPNLTDINEVNELITLRTLIIDKCKSIKSLLPISTLINLTHLNLNNCGNIPSLTLLKTCKSLKELFFIEDTIIEDGNVSFIVHLPKIEKVWFANRKHYNSTRETIQKEIENS